MTTRLPEFLAALEANGCRRSGQKWQCPAHDDQAPSLSVSEGEGGHVLVHCHAGCEPEAVVAAVGWTMADLFSVNGDRRSDFTIETTYPYTDEAGNPLFEIVRLVPKDFRPRHRDAKGQWAWNLKGVRRVLYHLPELIEGVGKDATTNVVEGEKDVHAIERAGGVATCNPGGAGKWRAEYSEYLRGARVRIVADNDAAGIKHARQVAKALLGIAASVEIVKAAMGKDAHDHLAAGLGLGDFVPLDVETGEQVSDSPGPDSRPKIVVRGELVPVCNEAEDALLHHPTTPLYNRCRMLARVVRAGRRKTPGLRRSPGTPYIDIVSIDHLRELLDRAAYWVARKMREGVMEERPTLPPAWVARVLAARGEWVFPGLEGLIEAPTMRPDGSLLDQPGYDPSTGLFYLPSIDFPQVPECSSLDDARAAIAVLVDPLSDFPFLEGSDRAAVVAATLTVVGRSAISGPVPAFGVRAPTPGTGKTLLIDEISIVATGRIAARMTAPRDDDEGRKRILSIGLDGTPIVLLDNIDGALGSPSLAAALTATEFADRLLGVSKIVRVSLRAVWFATGNGLRFKGDLGRRVIPIDLDPKVEHPEDRGGFRYPNLLSHVRDERARLVVAALTVLRAYHLAGRPGHGRPKVGTFEEWDDLVRGAVVWAGLDDPVKGRDRIREEGDQDLDTIRAVYSAWNEAFGAIARTTAEAISTAMAEDNAKPELRAALAALDSRGDGSKLNARVIGDRFKGWKGRVVDGLRLETAGRRHGAVLWRIVPADQPTEGSLGSLGSQGVLIGNHDANDPDAGGSLGSQLDFVGIDEQ